MTHDYDMTDAKCFSSSFTLWLYRSQPHVKLLRLPHLGLSYAPFACAGFTGSTFQIISE